MNSLKPIFSANSNRSECVALKLELPADGKLLESVASIVLFVDELVINGAVDYPGHNLSIFTRKLTATENATINVSGRDASQEAPAGLAYKAANATIAGDDGSNGIDGDRGKDAGNLTIVAGEISGDLTVNANGGRGGRGQDGGDGAKGLTGPDVSDKSISINSNSEGNNPGPEGGRGYQGGSAGHAGVSGGGGNGGRVWILTRTGAAQGVVVNNSAGEPGPLASHGEAGSGGDGGLGGYGVYCTMVSIGKKGSDVSRDVLRCAQSNLRGDRGERGLRGYKPDWVPGHGSRGADSGKDTSSATIGELEVVAPVSYANIVLRQAQLAYVNRDYPAASMLFTWLDDLGAASKPDVSAGKRAYQLLESFGTDQHDMLDGIGNRARAYRLQMIAGLDFFGNSPQYVPLVTVAFYAGQREWLLSQLDFFESQVAEIEKNDLPIQRLIEMSQAAKDKVLSQLAKLKSDKNTSAETATRSQAKSLSLISEIEAQKTALRLSQDDFVKAVGAAQNNCDFERVLSMGEAIVAIVSAIQGNYAAAASAAASVINAAKSGIDSLDKLQVALKRIRELKTGIDNIGSEYDKLKNLVGGSTKEQQNILLISKAEIDALTAPYLQLAEAHALRDTAQRLLDLFQAKNEAWLSYLSGLAQLAEAETLIADRQAEVDQLDRKIARSRQKNTPVALKDFLIKSRQEATMIAVRSLYSLNRAVAYWSLRNTISQPLRIEDFTRSAIREAYGRMSDEITRILEELGSEPSKFGNLEIVISSKKHPNLIETLKATGRLSFQVRPSISAQDIASNPASFLTTPQFAITRGLLINTVSVVLPGAQTSPDGPEVVGTLRHGGDVQLIDTSDRMHEFCHVSSKLLFRFDTASKTGRPVSFSAEEGSIYTARSPYTLWTLEILDSDNLGLNLKELSEVRIIFSDVTARPRN